MFQKNAKVSSSEGYTQKQWMVAILANTTLFTYGLQCGWISAMGPVLQSDASPAGVPLTDSQVSWLAAIPSLTAVVGVSVYSVLVDHFGRKKCIASLGVFQAISWIVKLYPTTNTLIVARICGGLAAGGLFNIVPMYVKEISQDNIRGTLGTLLIMSQNFGILAMYVMGSYLDYYTVLWVVVGIPLLGLVLMMKAPESPAYLVKIGRIDDAVSTIAFLRGVGVDEKLVHNEIDSIKAEDEKFKSIPNVSFVGILRVRAWRKGLIIMIFVMLAHGLNGGFTIINYASSILIKTGVTINPQLQSISIPVFMIAVTFVTMALVERLGRKVLLGGAFALATLSFAGVTAVLVVQAGGRATPAWLTVAAIVMAVCAYSGGVSPLPFIIMSEMFNFQIRAKVMGFLVTLGWLFSFVQLLAFGPIAEAFGVHVSFLCFAVLNLFGIFVVVVFLPETKGKTVLEIENGLVKDANK